MGESLPVALAKCISALSEGEANHKMCLEQYPEHKAALSSLLNVGSQLMYLPYISPGEQYYKESRDRILNGVLQSKRTVGNNREWNDVIQGVFSKAPVLAMLVVLFGIVFFGGREVAYAADTSLPGDSLYSLKLSIEDAQFALTDDAQDVLLHLEFAETRLFEIEQLTNLKRYDLIPFAVTGFEEHTQLAYSGLALLEQRQPDKGEQIAVIVVEKSGANLEMLNTLAVAVPGESQPALQQALTVALQLSGVNDSPMPEPVAETLPPASTASENSGGVNVDPTALVATTPTATPEGSPGNSDNTPGQGNSGNNETGNGNNNAENGNGSDNGNNAGGNTGNQGETGNGNTNPGGGNNGDNGNGNGNGNSEGNTNGNNGNNGNEDGEGDNGNGNGNGNGGGNNNGNNGNNGNEDGEEDNGNGNGGGNGNGNGNDG